MSNRTYAQDELRSVLAGFGIKDPTDVARYGSGHINDTFKVETASGPRYILQRVTDAFDKEILKSNILRVTGHLKSKGVYNKTATNVEVTKLLEGCNNGMRKYVNNGLQELEPALQERLKVFIHEEMKHIA